MEIIKIISIAVAGILVASITKSINKEVTLYVILATAILIIISMLDSLKEIFGFMENIYSDVTYGKEFFPVMFKVLALAYITDFTAQLCKDTGENSIASKVEMAGKIMIFYAALPVLTAILEMIEQILS